MKTVLAAAALVLAAGAAHAQNTAANQSACMGDAMAYCSAFVPDQGRIAACLQQNRARISPACQAAIGGTPGETRAAKKKRPRRSAS
jgi:hypothetical protein